MVWLVWGVGIFDHIWDIIVHGDVSNFFLIVLFDIESTVVLAGPING